MGAISCGFNPLHHGTTNANPGGDTRRPEMTGTSALRYLQDLCDRLDLRRYATVRRVVAAAALPVAVGFTAACYAAPYMDGGYGYAEEVCYNRIDDDRDGFTDCDDDECATLEYCLGCDDGMDNDGDGAADCDDASCQWIGPCADEICGDGVDNDENGAADCDDEECVGLEACLSTTDEYGVTRPACADQLDNDGNGLADCSDPSCAARENCAGYDGCWDYVDNDGDGLTDCSDPDCGPDCGY
jgi:hypothetical protein